MQTADRVILADGLSKQYRLGIRADRDKTLRDEIARNVARAGARIRRRRGSDDPARFTWALRDVSFEIARGEIVGIIGRNGAGKSTLLKILSRVTQPTSGRARIRGRLGSLLEVGTGFHGELTGRENVYLNGAILGMSRAEINRRFDEIVSFSEVEKFLDTPVKRYSSGMIVRLAFAVAAHLEPEILVVDEVLAVGDVGFQRKCIGKMNEVAGEGRTILLVSHNMAVIQALCSRGIFLERGVMHTDADIGEAVSSYLRSVEEDSVSDLADRKDRRGWNEVVLTAVDVVAGGGGQAGIATGMPTRFVFRTLRHHAEDERRLSCTFTIVNSLGQPVATIASSDHGPNDMQNEQELDVFVCEIDALPLVPGRYRLDVEIHGRAYLQDGIEGAATFDVAQGTLEGRPVAGGRPGDIAIPHRWIVPPLD
jgi:lipopolysaccharide transport system ATP-binding protein